METFRELAIAFRDLPASTIIVELTSAAVPPWSRDQGAEERMRSVTLPTKAIHCAFARAEGAGVEPGVLWLVLKGDHRLEVNNIVPTKKTELSYREYNAILQDFVERVVQPVKAKLAREVEIAITAAEYRLVEHLPADVYKQLEAFATMANRTTGSGHPSDQRRWLDFLTASHRQRCFVDAGVLARWFQEDMHWPVEASWKLASEYEFARDLLTATEPAA